MFVQEVPECFKKIREWMDSHYLQLNPGKTELIVFGKPSLLSNLDINGVFFDSVCVRLQPVIKNLGIHLDSSLNFRVQVVKLKLSCFNRLRSIAKMRPFLTRHQMTILIQAVIILSLDYCNAIYYGCSNAVISQLQMIQNRACRLIFGLKRKDGVVI